MSSIPLTLDIPDRQIYFHLGHRPALDGVRGVAIILVILHHLLHVYPPFQHVMSGGFIGVDLFFVLSGFLITSLIIEEHSRNGQLSFGKFYARRALRLLPAVAAALLVFVGLAIIFGATFVGITPLRVASIVGYFTNWVRAYESPESWFLSHFWSLAIEEQFYLIWPTFLVGLLFVRRRVALSITLSLAVGSALLMAVLLLSGFEGQRVYTGSDTRAFGLLAGCFASMALHWGYLPAWFNEKTRTSLAQASCVFLAVMAFRISDRGAALYFGGYALIAACATLLILHVTLDHSRITRIFQSKVLVWFGKRSYGLYVWHFPVYFLVSKFEMPVLAPVAIVLAILTAMFSYRFIELPFLRMKSRYTARLVEG